MKKINIMIVDDHKIFRDGLKLLFSHFSFIDKTFEAENGQDFLDHVGEINPDIVLMDINMPLMGGIEATVEALDRFPDLKIIVLTTFHNEDYIEQMMLAGIEGYMLKRSTPDEFESALKKVYNGGNFFSDEIIQVVLKNLSKKKSKNKSARIDSSFTEREKEVLNLTCKGFNNEQIAELIHISPKTVEKHKSSLFHKTNTYNTVNLIIYSFKNKLVEMPA